MESNKNIGCRSGSGKTIIVDPNKFDGLDSSNNVSVPLEDLSIYVQLETKKRARTILQDNLSINTGELKVKFIDGDDVSGRKVLTTRYTDLTTSLDSQDDNQSLGISAIDIAFNPSYAPLVTINFIDLRGSAMFQNDALLQNKYSTLFQMPYPIFTLTVKGYYGLPVKYDLHMTKFNAKFNSKTGNFEITASFIGYTYAMLSDMLIGYLRAIAHTQLGAAKYKEIKEKNPYILTLDELITAISKIDGVLKKLASDDPSINDYTVYRERLNQLGQFKDAIISLAVSMDIATEATEYKFLNVTNVSEDKFNEAINNYNASITKDVKIFNNGNDIKFSETELFSSNASTYESLTGDTELSTFINTNGIGGTFKIFDLRPIYKQIENKKNELETKIDNSKIVIGDKIKTAIASALKSDNSTSSVGLQPTIRNIVEIFTTSVEVLLSVLFKVSENAIKNEDRKKQLQRYAPTIENKDTSRYDYTNLTIENNVALEYYPWPEYRERDEKNGLQEAYLGGINVLQEPSKVDELNFIDDLLNAFYASLRTAKDAQKIQEKEQNSWGSANPLDTRLYGLTNYPFSRFNKNDPKDVLNTLISRAAIFMGISNKSLNINDIQTFAALEVQNMKLDVSDTIVKFLSGLNLTGATGTKAFINNVEEPLIKQITIDGSSYYYYNFIFNTNINTDTISDARSFKLLPLNNTSNSFKFEIDKDDTKSFSEAGNLFLTNYTSSVFAVSSDELLLKPDDGGVYLKIFTPDEFQTNKGTLPSTLTPSLTKINLSDLELSQTDFDAKVSSENILPQFGSNYGLPEFFTVVIPDIGESSFRSVFFVDNLDYKGGSTLCSTRKTNDSSKYDINNETNLVPFFTYDEFKSYFYGENRLRDELGQNRLILNNAINNQVGLSYPYVSFGANYSDISLFGSRFYYAQTSEYAKAFLFLHTFPWNGLVGENISCIFKVNEIINTFGNKAGFVSAPRLWAAFVGGLIWRADIRQPIIVNGQQVGGGSSLIDPIKFGILGDDDIFTTSYLPNLFDKNFTPKRNEYLRNINFDIDDDKKTYSMSFKNVYSPIEDIYLPIDVMLFQLPEQVKTEFKKAFFDFVNGSNSSWNQIKSKLELVNNCNDNLWKIKWDLTTPVNGPNDTIYSQGIKNNYDAVYDNGKKVIDNYVMLTRYKKEGFKNMDYNYVSELKDNSDAVTSLLNLMKEEIIISNNNFKIWNQELTTSNTIDRGAILIPKETFENYLNAVKINLQTDTKTEEEKQKEESQQLFGTTNQNLIKFQLYRTCKNIYDKWIGGSASEDTIIFRKDKDNVVVRNGLDVKLAENRAKLKGGDSTPTLIDSFRFVTRSFRDIGDEMYVNPKEVAESIATNPNNSFYDIVTSLLSQNNFNFQPLPNYINYSDENELKNMFKPISGLDTFSQGSTGPAFVCVYVGQPSKHLDFRDSSYQHDGIDFRCRDDGNLEQLNADDFTNEKKDYENNVAVFSVNYSQQNQNLFKDITLDQSEFSETNESLQVIDEIAKKGAENRTTTGGQNLYDVYSVRSYKAEVEMMGNVMIQPMMYFQLNNIPMFHGGYLITNVKHSIRPNNMLTNFTGVRVRNVETPMLDAASLYMPLLESLLGSDLADGKSVNSSASSISTADISFVAGCGTFAFTKPIVDGVNGFYESKPIRDLVALVESRGNYDAYNNGTAGVKGNLNYKPSTMTITEIKQAQAKPEEDKNRIFAVGKYQLIPDTFNSMVTALGFQPDDVFNAERQEKAGEWLILKGAGYRTGLRSYFAQDSTGNEKDLQLAITDLALEFASFPTYFGVIKNGNKITVNKTNPLGYNQNTAVYGGSAGNPSKAKFCAQDVAKALIQTWKNLNPSKKIAFDYSKISAISNQVVTSNKPAQTVATTFECDTDNIKATTNINSKSIILGDSTVSVFAGIGNTLKNNGIDISYNCVGKNVPWLNKQLKALAQTKVVYSTIKHVFVSIGTNDGYVYGTNAKKGVAELNELVTKLCPNAKKIVIPGTYGWGNVSNKTKADQDSYYKMFQDLGWIYQYPSANAFCATSSEAHDSNREWFKKSLDLIVSLNKT